MEHGNGPDRALGGLGQLLRQRPQGEGGGGFQRAVIDEEDGGFGRWGWIWHGVGCIKQRCVGKIRVKNYLHARVFWAYLIPLIHIFSMRKHYQLTLALSFVLLLLGGCKGMQSPDKSSTVTSPGTFGPRYNPNGDSAFVSPTNGEPINSISPADGTGRGDSLPGNIDWSNPPANLVLATVHFGFNQYNIEAADRKLLDAAAKSLAADPTAHVVAVGHCDWYGSEQYNLALGERRSNSVKNFAAKSGASAAQIEILSMGQYGATPDVKKDSAEAKHDRRVDLVKIPTGVTLPSGPPASAAAPVTAAP